MTTEISLKVNDKVVVHSVSPRMHLGDFIREQEALTGTHLGCEHGVCGACVVLLDGEPIRSCITYAVSCAGRSVTTIEGYGNDPIMSRLRKEFTEHHALQCGYCTPGMLATARDIVLRLPNASERIVRAELSGNLCRCTGYMGIVSAILAVLRELKESPDSSVEALRQNRTPRHDMTAAQQPFASIGFKPFEVPRAQDYAPVELKAAVNDRPDTQSGEGTSIEEEFTLPFPAEMVWTLMTDLPTIAKCLPGAHISSIEADRVKGGLSLKFGPMKASFDGVATISTDHRDKSATLNGAGQDRLTQSRATGKITYRIETVETNQTRVRLSMLYVLQGPLAQFSRSGMVKDFVRRLIMVFAENISMTLRSPEEALSGKQQNLRPISLFFSILFDRFRRLFGRGR